MWNSSILIFLLNFILIFFCYYFTIDKKNMEKLSLNSTKEEIEKYLSEKNQKKLIDYLKSELEGSEKDKFVQKLREIDFDLLGRLHKSYLEKEKENLDENLAKAKEREIEPLKDQYSKSDFTEEEQKTIMNLGYEKISEGKVAVLILAGGQGSRLGFDKAKGMYDIKMPSNKSLFEYIGNRFLSSQNLSKKILGKNSNEKNSTLMIMTSKENHKETEEFFMENNYFGIGKENVKLFPQDTLPAIDTDGNVIIKNKFEIFEAPNGNGGCFIALKTHNILNYLKEKQIEYLNVVSVDNPLTKVLDPFFVGLTYHKKEAMSAKAMPKNYPKEPVGVFVRLNKKPMMIDYADLNETLATLTEPNSDKLVYNASNMLHYLISVDLLMKILDENYSDLINDFHIAKKKIPEFNFNSQSTEEKFVNIPGVKFELFFNSLFLFAENLLLFSIDRSEEFAPIKNPDEANSDNPRIAREIMSRLFKKWLSKSNVEFDDNENDGPLEINFLDSYDGENLVHLQKKGKITVGEKGLFLDKI